MEAKVAARLLLSCAIVTNLSGCVATRFKPEKLPPFGSASSAEPAPAPQRLRSLLFDESCPLAQVDVNASETLPGVLSDILIGAGADDVVAQLIGALNESAKQDRDGFTLRGSTPDYFYRYYPTSEPKLRVPRCLIIAEGEPVESADEAVFCGGMCAEDVDSAAADTVARQLRLRSPTFYAEISIRPADTRDAVRGQLVYLWYPAPLVKRRQADRNLTISATIRSPSASGTDGDAVSTMLFQLDGVMPGRHVQVGQLLTAGNWTGVPDFPSEAAIQRVQSIRNKTPMPSMFGLAPVNVEVVINEQWRPNPLLQWLSRVVGADASKAKLQTAVQAAVVPTLRAQAEAEESDAAFAAEQAYREARLKALEAQSDFLVKCSELSSAPNREIARLAVEVARVAWEKEAAALRAAATKVNIAPGAEAIAATSCPEA